MPIDSKTPNFAESETPDPSSLLVAERLSVLMAQHGIPARQQAGFLTELCGLSPSQARRKLRGATWSFGEVLAVVTHFNGSLDELFQPGASGEIARSPMTADHFLMPLQEARFLLGTRWLPCRVRLGAQASGKIDGEELIATQTQEGWMVGAKAQLEQHLQAERSFHADQILLSPPSNKPSIRIAILDDDPATSESLCEWFNAAGYLANAFTSSSQLISSGIEENDAFIIDFLLAGGESSQETIDQIRRVLPAAPILLLTGKLRDGQVSESDLTTLLRTSNVTFFEKPVRPSVLAASLENAIDLIAKRSAG